MVLLLSIIIGAVFGIIAARKGFYVTWALLVNITVSVYLAVFLTPTIFSTIGSLAESPYAVAICLAIIAVSVFAILHAVAVIFFTGQFNISFPKILNTAGAGLLGFLAGLLVCGFVGLVILTIPIFQDSFLADQLAETADVSVVKACNCINFFSRQHGRYRAEDVVEWLLYVDTDIPYRQRHKEEKPTPGSTAEPNEVNSISCPVPSCMPSGNYRNISACS